MSAQPEEWEPGDPPFSRVGYGGYLFNWRGEIHTETCACGDRASWPNPLPNHNLDRLDRTGGPA